jgi:hypothetical protein
MKMTETLDRLYLEWSQFTDARTEREIQVRTILAGTDADSLPRDMTLEQIAQARMDDIKQLREELRAAKS